MLEHASFSNMSDAQLEHASFSNMSDAQLIGTCQFFKHVGCILAEVAQKQSEFLCGPVEVCIAT